MSASVMKRSSASGRRREDLLEGHGPAEPQVSRAEDAADAALGELPVDDVVRRIHHGHPLGGRGLPRERPGGG